MLGSGFQIVENRTAAGRQDAVEGVGNLAEVGRSFAPIGETGADEDQDREESKDRGISRGLAVAKAS